MAIADAQKRIAAARLNFDLYAKRYAVFEAAHKLWVEVVQHADVEVADIKDFSSATGDAVFLFDNDVVNYLDAFRMKVAKQHSLKSQVHEKTDFNRGVIRFPPSRTKNKREHEVPISDPVRERGRTAGTHSSRCASFSGSCRISRPNRRPCRQPRRQER
jgi:hypothetical protein